MKGTYITKEGTCVEILDFDAENKIAYIHFGSGEKRWAAESEYSEWNQPISVPDIPSQMEEEHEDEETVIDKPIKKPTKKKAE